MTDSSEKDRPTKRIVPAKKPEIEVSIVSPSLDMLMNDAMSIIEHQLAVVKAKLRRTPELMLSPQEARSVRDYMEVLVKLSRENREMTKQFDFENMSNEELEIEIKRLKELEQKSNK